METGCYSGAAFLPTYVLIGTKVFSIPSIIETMLWPTQHLNFSQL